MGFRVVINQDNSAKLVADDDEVLSHTVGNLHGTGYFDTPDPTSNIHQPSGNWVVTETLTRGINLWHRQFFKPDGAFGEKCRLLETTGISRVSIIFLLTTRRTPWNDNCSVLQYRKNPGETILGSKTIIHHALDKVLARVIVLSDGQFLDPACCWFLAITSWNITTASLASTKCAISVYILVYGMASAKLMAIRYHIMVNSNRQPRNLQLTDILYLDTLAGPPK
ncbi:hypothetical protein EDB81DRAFT_889366 [Dactylonectria macrodidyma]|uniref:Uncharacterized protein n=1 Tax=Dactylonectria macrodidyma TaxID=307937 RepID=A0A9P9E052_9HYPO|nr:hypothetical protein EDB81DRAFT_889366 [Dactylonectria macrodidyma]